MSMSNTDNQNLVTYNIPTNTPLTNMLIYQGPK